jgi:hypothetical protein
MKGSMLDSPTLAGGLYGWCKERRAFYLLALVTWLLLWLAKKLLGFD